MNQPFKQSCGFTLIEILIALAIFATLAVISAVGLRSVLDMHSRMQANNQRMREILTAVTLIRRDVNQIVAREILDSSGSQLPALLIPNRYLIEFTRMGYTNPNMEAKRSTLQRVGYQFKNHKLYRLTWLVLDRAPHAKVQRHIILSDVKNFKLNFINEKGLRVQTWSEDDILPRAVIFTLQLEQTGDLNLFIPIRGRGYAT